MGKWRQGIALFLTGILIMTSIFTWNSPIRVHAKEAVIKSSADGFEYRLRTYASVSYTHLVTQLVTDANGYGKITDLYPGYYRLHEKYAPLGYKTSSQDVYVTIDQNTTQYLPEEEYRCV